MKTVLSSRSRERGSALVTVILLSFGLLIITASVLGFSLSERRLNYREAMRLEARNAAEAVSEYGMSQVRQFMDSRSDFSSTTFTTNEGQFSNVPSTFWGGGLTQSTGTTQPELVIGLINQVSSSNSSLYYYDPTDSNNISDPLAGCYALRFDIKIISKATVKPPTGGVGGVQTAYMTQTLSARACPLFSHAIFYNMDLELWPGPAMNILGGVHTNGNLWIKKQSTNGLALNFEGPVRAAGSIYAGVKCVITNTNGSTDDLSSYTDNIYFSTPPPAGATVGTLLPMYTTGTTSTKFWHDQTWGAMGGPGNQTAATDASFKSWATTTYTGYVQSKIHGVIPSTVPGLTIDATTGKPLDARALIEVPKLTTDAGYNATLESQKYSVGACLYIVVNPDPVNSHTGHMPNGSTITVPGGKIRAFKKDGTEVILPGQDDFGTGNTYHNVIGTTYINCTGLNNSTVLGTLGINPLIKVRAAEMTDMRRAVFNYANSRSSTNPYTPKVIDCIDVDMTTLKFIVDTVVNGKTSTTYYLWNTPPDGTATNSTAWTHFIYYTGNTSATETKDLTPTNLLSALRITNFSASDWNGAIYIESTQAETRQLSGVRLINGRGQVASKSDGSGLTIATNDEVYVFGNYNADGNIDQSTTGTTNSGVYAESANEAPCAIAGDALTILSAPSYANSGSRITQSLGWNDAVSGLRNSSSGSVTAWKTTAPSGSNTMDGDSTSTYGYKVPYDKNSGSLSTGAVTQKFGGNDTEIASAFLAGIVESNSNIPGTTTPNGQNSGGANNFPRFNEDFSASGTQKAVAIRGSIVAMFDSQVGVEPWNWRTFNAPKRLWGFADLFNRGHFPPLTPRVMSYRRVDFNDIDGPTYASLKSSWGL